MKRNLLLMSAAIGMFLSCQTTGAPSVEVSAPGPVTSNAPAISSVTPVTSASSSSNHVPAGLCLTPSGVNRMPLMSVTPGKLCTDKDLDFDGFRYPSHVAYCRRHITGRMKNTVAMAYGIPKSDYSKYEFDHYIPLAAGGANDLANLWPQPIEDAKEKDVIEDHVYHGLKSGTMSQAEAVTAIRSWRPATCK